MTEEQAREKIGNALYGLINGPDTIEFSSDGWYDVEGKNPLEKETICQKYGIPDQLHDYVKGDTPEEMYACAETLAKYIGSKPAIMPMANPEGECDYEHYYDPDRVEARIRKKFYQSFEDAFSM